MTSPDPAEPHTVTPAIRRAMLVRSLMFWGALFVFDLAKDQLMIRLEGRVTVTPEVLWYMVTESVIYWGVWAALTPFALSAVVRWTPWRTGWRSFTAIHASLALVFALTHLLGSAAFFRLRSTLNPGWTVLDQFVSMVGGTLLLDVFVYWALVAAFLATWWHRALHRSRLAEAELARRVAELEATSATARLDALRRQLDPHFLFNTLNAVAGLARRGETRRVTAMLARLGEFLRVGLQDQGRHEVRLDAELRYLDLYVAIERERFGDRLRVHTEVPPELGAGLVPALILQPLVENAVHHGLDPHDGGAVTVTACLDDGRLALTVHDSGSGFHGRRPEGVGLANTRARLQQLYGADGRVTVEPGGAAAGNGDGARVTITLPWHTTPRVDAPA